MKKVLIYLIIIILSLIITFVLFEQLSWYHFGDIPTDSVLYRLIIFFFILTIIMVSCSWLVIGHINKKLINRNYDIKL